MERGNRTIQEKIAAIKHDEGFAGKTSFPWMSWLPRIMYSINTQINSTSKEVPYKLVFGHMPRCQVVPGAEQHIVMEEEITEIIHFSSPLKESPSDPVPAIPVEDKPAVTSNSLEPEPHKWVIQKETVLNWTPSISPATVSSASDSSDLPSLPSSPNSTEIEFSKPSKFIPSPPVGSYSNTDLLHEDLSSDSPESRQIKYQRVKIFKLVIKFLSVFLRLYSKDLQRIPSEIVSVTGGEKIKLYKITTSVGLVKNAFSGGDLAACSGTVHVNKDKLVSIRQAALEINSANRFTVNRCKWKGQCSNAQCSCIR